jgi:hypothetical protein
MEQLIHMISKSFDKATSEWVQVRKKLYIQIKSEVSRLLGSSWNEMLPLEKKYAKELLQSWRSVKKEDFYDRLLSADIILFGDFHALQQSQRGHLRLLREWPSKEPIVLAVEFFQARHQKYLDLWLKGKLTDKKLLEKTNWIKNWGFPWEHYKPLMEWAKAQKIPVWGVNWGLNKTSLKTLKTRENFSVICLKKIKQKNPKSKVILIYGDLHLAKNQLPLAIKSNEFFCHSKLVRVFQNSEQLYFQALEKGLESKIEIVQFKSGDFCIQSVPPWVKWQSYLLFLENTYDRQIDDWDFDVDHTDHVAKLVNFLSEEFKIKLKNSKLAIYTANDPGVFFKIRKALSKLEWQVIKKWITDQRSFYIPELELGYLGQVTVNHTATLAGEYVHAIMAKRKNIYIASVKDFEKQIWIHAMAFMGSKVINHKRKSNSIEDLRRALLMKETSQRHRQVLLLALQQKVREIRFVSHGQWLPLEGARTLDLSIYSEASRLLGSMLGEKIYNLYQSKRWSLEKIKQLMKIPLESNDKFNQFYYKVLKSF